MSDKLWSPTQHPWDIESRHLIYKCVSQITDETKQIDIVLLQE